MTDLGTKSLSYGDSIRLQGPMDVLLEYHPDNQTSPHALSASVPVKPTEPPPPTTGSNILGVDFASRPRNNAAWARMVAASKNLGAIELSDVSGTDNGELLALAFVAAATGDSAMATKVVTACKAGLASSTLRTLEMARNLAPIAIALNAVGDHTLDAQLKTMRDKKVIEQGSVVDCHNKRPNNWGTCSGLARIAVDRHIGDDADYAKAVDVFKAWVTEPGAPAHTFDWGDTSWQANASKPVGINPRGSVKSNVNIDGVLPEDQRRGGSFPSWTNQNYVWQALGEVAATSHLIPGSLHWGDDAIKRAYALYASRGYGCGGDDGWQYAEAAQRGVTIEHDGYAAGKSFGWSDWLYL